MCGRGKQIVFNVDFYLCTERNMLVKQGKRRNISFAWASSAILAFFFFFFDS